MLYNIVITIVFFRQCRTNVLENKSDNLVYIDIDAADKDTKMCKFNIQNI